MMGRYTTWALHLQRSRLPESNRGHRGSRAVTFFGKPYYSRALYQAELRRDVALIV